MSFLLDIGWKPEKICQALKNDDGKYPKGLQPEEYDASKAQETYLHQYVGDDLPDWFLDGLPSMYANPETDAPPKGFEDLRSRDIEEEASRYLPDYF